jgi:hypothetical protein
MSGRERGGANVLFGARIRSKVAKARGDALSDLSGGDIESSLRVPAPPALADIGTGGELVPADSSELRDTVTNPDYVAVDASLDRLNLADHANVLEMALDAADSIGAKNSLEKMLVHQMTVLHRSTMKMSIRMDDMLLQFQIQRFREGSEFQRKNLELCRLANTMARLSSAYQQAFISLQRIRSDGRQLVTVQHVHVAGGGQAVIAANLGRKRGEGAERKRGSVK